MNVHSNNVAMKVAEYTYNNYMSCAWGPQSCCFHPRALEELHEKGVEEALDQFQANRPQSEDDDYKAKLLSVSILTHTSLLALLRSDDLT